MASPAIWIENKVAYARSEGVQSIFGVSRETISKYVKNGMPYTTKKKVRIYNLQEVISWKKKEEIEKLTKDIDEFENGLGDDFINMSSDQLNRALKVYAAKKLKHEAIIKEIQEKAEKKMYIPADAVDKNMTNLLKEFISILKQIRETLPKKLENMNEEEIEDMIDEYFDALLNKMNKAASNV